MKYYKGILCYLHEVNFIFPHWLARHLACTPLDLSGSAGAAHVASQTQRGYGLTYIQVSMCFYLVSRSYLFPVSAQLLFCVFTCSGREPPHRIEGIPE